MFWWYVFSLIFRTVQDQQNWQSRYKTQTHNSTTPGVKSTPPPPEKPIWFWGQFIGAPQRKGPTLIHPVKLTFPFRRSHLLFLFLHQGPGEISSPRWEHTEFGLHMAELQMSRVVDHVVTWPFEWTKRMFFMLFFYLDLPLWVPTGAGTGCQFTIAYGLIGTPRKVLVCFSCLFLCRGRAGRSGCL